MKCIVIYRSGASYYRQESIKILVYELCTLVFLVGYDLERCDVPSHCITVFNSYKKVMTTSLTGHGDMGILKLWHKKIKG